MLVGGSIVVGTALGTGGTILMQKAIKVVKSKRNSKNAPYLESGRVFTVHAESKDNNGLEFRCDDKYKILNRDADAILLEIIGNDNNPHFVSGDFLRAISDFT